MTPDRIDQITFAAPASEARHRLTTEGGRSRISDGGRVALPLDPPSARLADISFELIVDPVDDTYLTLELSGDDDSDLKTMVLIDGTLTSYRQFGDHEAIDIGSRAPLPGRTFRSTQLLPKTTTSGRTTVTVTLRTYSVEYRPSARDAGYEIADTPSRRYLSAWTSREPAEIIESTSPPRPPVRPRLAPEQERRRILELRDRQLKMIRDLEAAADSGDHGALTLSRYQDGLRFYADSMLAPWSPARNPEQKRAGLHRIIAAIDFNARQYHRDITLTANGGHQSDWGGYFSVIGEALYTVEPLLNDPAVLGPDLFQQLLDQPLPIDTVDGEHSIAGRLPDGAPITRRHAWERMLKASFDFARSRLSYIFNQVMLTYEGAWRAHEGLRILGSSHYEGRQRSHTILREAFGLADFLGEEVLVGEDGQSLDLTHSLFHHDKNAEYTDDVVQQVMRGRSRSAIDGDGAPVRRRPYGDNYRGLTARGLSRENNYVGVYGELILLLVARIHRLADHPDDAELRDDLIRGALRNAEARGHFRYQGTDPDGFRTMLMEQIIDERTTAHPGRIAYAAEAVSGAALLWAGLEQLLHNAGDRYRTPDWDSAWHQARRIVGWTQQMLLDGQYLPAFDDGNDIALRNDVRILETYDWITSGRTVLDGRIGAGELLPHTDVDAYTDAELTELGTTREAVPDTFTWTDTDASVISLRVGHFHGFIALNWRNVGYTGVGRAHLLHGHTEQLVQFATHGDLTADTYYLRGETREAWRQSAPDVVGENRHFAWTGQMIPVAGPPVARDNNAHDNPYSARADLLSARIGDLFVAVNTTTPELGNDRSISVDIPGTNTGHTLDGTPIPTDERGRASLPPATGISVLLDSIETLAPAAITHTAVINCAGSIGISWPRTPNAVRYIVTNLNTGRQRMVTDTGTTPHLLIDTTTHDSLTIAAQIGAGITGPARAVAIPGLHPADHGWTTHLIGDAHGTIRNDTDEVRFDITATGPAQGDDARVHSRWRPDNIAFAARTITDQPQSLTATITSRQNGLVGITLRDGTGPLDRYVILGVCDDGLEVRTRTLDTREDIGIGNPGVDAAGGIVRSPTRELYSPGAVTGLRLERRPATETVIASVKGAGGVWTEVWSGVVPMLPIVAAGFVSTGANSIRLAS